MSDDSQPAISDGPDAVINAAPLGGTRDQAIHRLQVGLSGLAAMLLLVGLANIIQDRARIVDEQAVPEAAPTTEPSVQPAQTDPLADAGVVPDIPVAPTPVATQSPAIVPEQGNTAESDPETP